MIAYKTIINPKTGKMETVGHDPDAEAQATAKLARDRRELRDMIAGNVQFYDDPNARPAEAPQSLYEDEPVRSIEFKLQRFPGWYLCHSRFGSVSLLWDAFTSRWTHYATQPNPTPRELRTNMNTDAELLAGGTTLGTMPTPNPTF